MRLEQRPDVDVVALFDCCAVAIAGVVDQHVDTAEPLLGLLHGGRDLLGFGDVERGRENPIGCGVGQVGHPCDVARGDDGVVAGADHGIGERAAESGRAAGDEPGGHVR